jgi:hypothetical protein
MSIALKASSAVAGLAISRFSMAIAVALALCGTTSLAESGAQACMRLGIRNGSHYYVLNFYQSYATPYWH